MRMLPSVVVLKVAVIVGLVPTSPAGVSIAHRLVSPKLEAWTTAATLVNEFPAPSVTVLVTAVESSQETVAMSFVPLLTLLTA